jgi:hypothetical protein
LLNLGSVLKLLKFKPLLYQMLLSIFLCAVSPLQYRKLILCHCIFLRSKIIQVSLGASEWLKWFSACLASTRS